MFSGRVQTGVFGPQAGEFLSHGAEVLLHGSFLDLTAVCGKLSCADSMQIDL
jgi:hypothetical protein